MHCKWLKKKLINYHAQQQVVFSYCQTKVVEWEKQERKRCKIFFLRSRKCHKSIDLTTNNGPIMTRGCEKLDTWTWPHLGCRKTWV